MSGKKSDTGPNGKKRKIQFAAEDGEETKESQPSSSRRDMQRVIAERRAAHFARADPSTRPSASSSSSQNVLMRDRAPISSTPTGTLRRGQPIAPTGDQEEEDANAEAEAWPGPFSTALAIMAKRDAAKKAREEAIASQASKEGAEVYVDTSLMDEYDLALHNLTWPPSADQQAHSTANGVYRQALPSLATMCAAVLARTFDSVREQEIGYLQITEREKVAVELAKLRRCDAQAALKLAVESSQYLVLPECSEVDEECLVRALEQAAGVAASRLPIEADEEDEVVAEKPAASRGKKGSKAGETADGGAPVKAGRKKKEAASSKAVVPEPSAVEMETALIVVRLRNCGRGMTDRTAAVCINLAQGKLEILQLTGCFRLNDAALSGLLLSCRASLTSLDLTCNSRLSGEALGSIRHLSNLQELTLDNCTQLVDADLLKLLPGLGEGSSGSSSCSSADAEYPSLAVLSLGGLIEVTDASVVPLVKRYGLALQTLNLSGCVRLSDETLRAIRQHCESLRVLGLGQLGEATTAAMLGLFVVHPGGQREYAGDLSSLSTVRRDSSSGSAAAAVNTDGVGATEVEDLYISARIGHLEEVCLQGTVCVTDDVIVQLCEGNKRTLRALDVNGCYQLTSRSIMALRRHCPGSLQTLDLSFVRGCSQEAVGALVDAGVACDALQTLTVWGCTQLGDKFWRGYRKDNNLQVVGRMTA